MPHPYGWNSRPFPTAGLSFLSLDTRHGRPAPRQGPGRHRPAAPVPLPASPGQLGLRWRTGRKCRAWPAGVTAVGDPGAHGGEAGARSLPVGGAALGTDAHRDAGWGARRFAQLPPLPGGPPPPLPGLFPAIGGSARAGAGARRELPPPAPQQHSARPAGRGGLKATATAAAAAAEAAAAGGGDSAVSSLRPVRSGTGAPVPGGSAQVVAGGRRGAAADRAVHERRDAAAGGASARAPERGASRPPAVVVQPSHLAGVSTAGVGTGAGAGAEAGVGWGPPAAAARGRPTPGAACGRAEVRGRSARRAGRARSGRAPAGPGVGACCWPRGRRPPRPSGARRALLRGSAALGCALITGQMSEPLRAVLLTAWLFERCHCSASSSSSSLSLECFTLDQLPREPGEGFSVALPLSPFHGSIPPLCACNLCLRQKQRAFS